MSTFFSEKANPPTELAFNKIVSSSRVETGEDGSKFIRLDDMIFDTKQLMLGGFVGRRWPNSTLFYDFDANVSEVNRVRFEQACKEWSNVAVLRFVRRSNQPDYVLVKADAEVNDSKVGMIGGEQILRVTSWGSKFRIAHEIGHALGLNHEHVRSDREDFVTIKTENILADKLTNFAIEPQSENLTSYDFDSIMHYGPFDFTSNSRATIVAKPAHTDDALFMGNRQLLTGLDAAGMATRYPAPPSNPHGYREFRRRVDELHLGHTGIAYGDGSNEAKWIDYLTLHCVGNFPTRAGYYEFRRRLDIAYRFRYDRAVFNETYQGRSHLDLQSVPNAIGSSPAGAALNEFIWHCVGNPPGEDGYKEWHRLVADDLLPKVRKTLPRTSLSEAIIYLHTHVALNLAVIED